MTLELLKILGHEIAKTDWPENSKQVLWCACTTAFFGSFRLGEILPKSEYNAIQYTIVERYKCDF